MGYEEFKKWQESAGATVTDIKQSTDWPGMTKFYKQAGEYVLPALMPGLGAGSLLRFGPKLVPPILRQVGGALAGTAANQASGLTPPTVEEYLSQAGWPLGARGMGVAKRFLGKFGTEGRGAETLNQLIPQELGTMQTRYQPPTSAKTLFGQLQGSKANIPVPETRKAATEQLKNIGTSIPGFQESYGKLSKQLKGVQGATKQTGFLPIETYQRLLHDVGTHIQAADRAGGVEAHGYKGLYRALMEDLEKAPSRMSGPDAETLGTARDAFKREKFLDEIAHAARPFTKRGSDLGQSNVNKIINRLNDKDDYFSKNFASSFSVPEQQKILSTLRTLNQMPAVPSGAGQSFGSGGFWKHEFPSMMAGGGLGYAAGQGEGAALGATVGAALPPAARMVRDFGLAWNTESGRAMIGDMVRNNHGRFSPEMWSTIEAFAAAQQDKPGAELYKMVGR